MGAAFRGHDFGGLDDGALPVVVQRGRPRPHGRRHDLFRQLRRQVGAGLYQEGSFILAACAGETLGLIARRAKICQESGEEADADAAGPSEQAGGLLQQSDHVGFIVLRQRPKRPAPFSRRPAPRPYRLDGRRRLCGWEQEHGSARHAARVRRRTGPGKRQDRVPWDTGQADRPAVGSSTSSNHRCTGMRAR